MTCGSCGATIADKAIVCYRCGAPTAIPTAPRATSRPPAATRAAPMVSAASAAVLAGVALVVGDESAAWLPAVAGSGLTAVVAGWTWVAGRRR